MSFKDRLKNDINGLTQIFFRKQEKKAGRVLIYLPALSQYLLEQQFTPSADIEYFQKDLTEDSLLVNVDLQSETITNSPTVTLYRTISQRSLKGISNLQLTGSKEVNDVSLAMDQDHHGGIDGHFLNPLPDNGYADYLIKNRKAISNFIDILNNRKKRKGEVSWEEIEDLGRIYRLPEIAWGSPQGRNTDLIKNSILFSSLDVSSKPRKLENLQQALSVLLMTKVLVRTYLEYEVSAQEAFEEQGDPIERLKEQAVDAFLADLPPGETPFKDLAALIPDLDNIGAGPYANKEEFLAVRLFRQGLPFAVERIVDTYRYSKFKAAAGEDLPNEDGWFVPTRDEGSNYGHSTADKLQVDFKPILQEIDKKSFPESAKVQAFIEADGRLFVNEQFNKQLARDLRIEGMKQAPKPIIRTFLITPRLLDVADAFQPTSGSTAKGRDKFSAAATIDMMKLHPRFPLPESSTQDGSEESPIVVDIETFFQRYLNSSSGPISDNILSIKEELDSIFRLPLLPKFKSELESNSYFKNFTLEKLKDPLLKAEDSVFAMVGLGLLDTSPIKTFRKSIKAQIENIFKKELFPVFGILEDILEAEVDRIYNTFFEGKIDEFLNRYSFLIGDSGMIASISGKEKDLLLAKFVPYEVPGIDNTNNKNLGIATELLVGQAIQVGEVPMLIEIGNSELQTISLANAKSIPVVPVMIVTGMKQSVDGTEGNSRVSISPQQIRLEDVNSKISNLDESNVRLYEYHVGTTMDQFLSGRSSGSPLGATAFEKVEDVIAGQKGSTDFSLRKCRWEFVPNEDGSKKDGGIIFRIPAILQKDEGPNELDPVNMVDIAFEEQVISSSPEIIFGTIYNLLKSSSPSDYEQEIESVFSGLSAEFMGYMRSAADFMMLQSLDMIKSFRARKEYLERVRDFVDGEASALGFTGAPAIARENLSAQFQKDFPSLAGKAFPFVEQDVDFLEYLEEEIPYTPSIPDAKYFDDVSVIYDESIRVPLFGRCLMDPNIVHFSLKYSGGKGARNLDKSLPIVFNELASYSDAGENEFHPLNAWPGGLLEPDNYKSDYPGKTEGTESELQKGVLDIARINYKKIRELANQDKNPFPGLDPEQLKELTDQQIQDALETLYGTVSLSLQSLEQALNAGASAAPLGVALSLLPRKS